MLNNFVQNVIRNYLTTYPKATLFKRPEDIIITEQNGCMSYNNTNNIIHKYIIRVWSYYTSDDVVNVLSDFNYVVRLQAFEATEVDVLRVDEKLFRGRICVQL